MVVANWNRIVFLTLHFFYLAYDWNHHNTHCTNSWIDEVISMWKYVCGIIKPDYCSFTDQIVFWHSTENLFLPIAAIDLKGFFELNKCLYIYICFAVHFYSDNPRWYFLGGSWRARYIITHYFCELDICHVPHAAMIRCIASHGRIFWWWNGRVRGGWGGGCGGWFVPKTHWSVLLRTLKPRI